jgi:copper resistance protein C
MATQRTIINVIAYLALLLLGGAVSFAHAQLTRASPPPGGNIASAPNEVTVNFSEQLEPAFSTIVVRDSVGKQVDKADVHVDDEDRTIMRVSLPPLPRGVYIVKWRALTVDTHRTEGAFTFRIGE